MPLSDGNSGCLVRPRRADRLGEGSPKAQTRIGAPETQCKAQGEGAVEVQAWFSSCADRDWTVDETDARLDTEWWLMAGSGQY
jgi:hypothetical protein